MSNRCKTLTLPIFTLMILLTPLSSVSSNPQSPSLVAPGKWSFSANPYMRAGYETAPVFVYSTTSDVRDGITVNKVGVENRTSRKVTAVKLNWYLSTRQDSATILKHGQSPLLKIPGGIAANDSLELQYTVLASFAKLSRSLARNGTLTGNFRLEVAVGEAYFEDGSQWLMEILATQPRQYRAATLVNASYGKGARTATLQNCPD